MILNEIVEKTRIRISERKDEKSLDTIMEEALQKQINNTFPFEKSLKNPDIAFICEVKKASPSKGIIAEEFSYLDIAKEYEEAGANAISVLTEPFYFKGKDIFLEEISKEVKVPILRKDFVIDEYMIYEAKILGASAVLLICSILDKDILKKYIDLANRLGMSALVEAHNEKEINMALSCGARIIGVNNRDLKNFTVDINNSVRLRRFVPTDIIFISESGIKTAEDIDVLKKNNVNAVLIGETLMKSKNKKKALDELRGFKYE
ncbi:indole-3-glycerol phosphate synthase TrpC [Clostridium sp. D53t1_180928_C8]|uniref:indole-3-glycerol phosphate synthase TrpC n=1 Tax=Clostridium sp. D53t1_180928_C8 TaxID=2787101 RepID=UPI0018AA649A|nr:indole-3-glycerol phosphate synthase TrpC [Clostridium sp. D53t1_180928_C8]